jgi:hypothetical protein
MGKNNIEPNSTNNTNDAINAGLDALAAENAALRAQVLSLETALAERDQRAEEMSDAEATETAKLLADIASLKTLLADREKTICELTDILAAQANKATANSSVTIGPLMGITPPAGELPTVIVNEQPYRFLKPMVNFNGNTYTAAEAAVLPELLAAIVAIEGQKILASS